MLDLQILARLKQVAGACMNELPWFPFYPGDWLSSETIAGMEIASEGAYHRLLCYAWRSEDGTLPNDEPTLKTLAKWQNGADFSSVLKAFVSAPRRPDRLINPRLYQEWLKAKSVHSGKAKAANIRWTRIREQKQARQDAKIVKKADLLTESYIPDNWQPTEPHMKLAHARGLDCNLEAAHFKGKAQEKRWRTKDWDLKFKNWLLQEIKFREQRKSS